MQKLHKITIEGKEIEYVLTRTNRKTIGISIGIEVGIKVAAPKRATQQQVEEVMLGHGKWVIEKLKTLEGKSFTKQEFNEGESFSYLGKEYVLEIIEIDKGEKAQVIIVEDRLRLYISTDNNNEENIKKAILEWYRQEANILLKQRVEHLRHRTGLHPKAVMIKEQKSRFGSCSSKGNINLNWKLIMAPIEVIDYVIVHELCHLKEMNHSKDFWNLVESYMKDYKEKRKWLKEKGGYIRLI